MKHKFKIGDIVEGNSDIYPVYYIKQKGKIKNISNIHGITIKWFNFENEGYGFFNRELKKVIDFKQKIKFIKEILSD